MNPVYVSERVAEYHRQEWVSGGPASFKQLFLHGADVAADEKKKEKEEEEAKGWLGLFPSDPGGLHAVRPHSGWARIQIPGVCWGSEGGREGGSESHN